MYPASFEESNLTLNKPPQLTHDQCQTIAAFKGKMQDGLPIIVTCWKFDQKELEEIQKTGRIWIIAVGETTQPMCPVAKKPNMQLVEGGA